METLKIVIIGDGIVGKSSFVRRIRDNSFEENYEPTLGVEVYPIHANEKCYNIWDCSGVEKFMGLSDGYYIGAQGAIIMCDPTNISSIKNIEKWKNEFQRVNGNIPIVYVINKSELLPKEFEDERFIKISCKENTNIDKVLSQF